MGWGAMAGGKGEDAEGVRVMTDCALTGVIQ